MWSDQVHWALTPPKSPPQDVALYWRRFELNKAVRQIGIPKMICPGMARLNSVETDEFWEAAIDIMKEPDEGLRRLAAEDLVNSLLKEHEAGLAIRMDARPGRACHAIQVGRTLGGGSPQDTLVVEADGQQG